MDGVVTIFNMAKRTALERRKGPRGGRGGAKKVWTNIFLKDLRLERGWSQDKLALESGVSTGQISEIEKKNSAGSPESLETLAAAMGLKLGDLFERPEKGSRLFRAWVPEEKLAEIARVVAAIISHDE